MEVGVLVKEETVKVLLVSTNIEYYESKGYSIPREKNK